ncbi:MAG TPA: helix-turn-helix domain-containing protein [Mycobacteriales bacterium]|nr:helix-turn-helix domain-containing protein [Mycobacteriales bacterium]
MRNRAWQGDPPTDDDDARDRIISAAMRCIDRHGPTKTSLSDVAAELGVTRQTVYRLFPSTEDLFRAVSIAAADAFVDQLAARVRGMNDPADMLVECMAFTIERLLKERYLSLLLVQNRAVPLDEQFTSAVPAGLTRKLLEQLPVDWNTVKLTPRNTERLIEIYLRTLQSFIVDPGPPRSARELRALLAVWFGPAVRSCLAGQPVSR